MQVLSYKTILKNKELNFVDMHHHSNISDGSKTPEYIYKKFRKKGLGVCLTDHNRIKGSLFLCKQKDIFTIPSIEVTTGDLKDFLIYFHSADDLQSFWQKEIQGKEFSVFPVIKAVRTPNIVLLEKLPYYNAFAVLAHPFAPYPKKAIDTMKNKEIMKRINAIEAYNFLLGEYDATLKIILPFKKPLTAGSDDHSRPHFSAFTGSHSFEIEEFLKEITRKKHIIYIKKLNKFRKIVEQLKTARNVIFE